MAKHPHPTLTGLCNVLEKLRAGTAPCSLDTADRRVFDDGLVLILKEYHDALDEAVAAVLSVLSTVSEPASATALAVRFRQGRRVLPQVEAVLAALVRVGGLVTSPDGGRSFLPRRAA